jgi:TatD DNase family protein
MESSFPYIDFHTHKLSSNEERITAVTSIDPSELEPPPNNLYTIGVHPWNANTNSINLHLNNIKTYANSPSMVGIGEVGLDKMKGPRLDIQQKILEKQIEIASEIDKPVTIHCVKAWDELLALKARFGGKTSWAIHGFNGSQELAKQLLDKGFFLSIGAAMLNEKSKLQESITQIPVNRLFFETDTTDVDIAQIYAVVAVKLDLSINDLRKSIAENFSYFFRR